SLAFLCLGVFFMLVFLDVRATPVFYTLSLHDALPIFPRAVKVLRSAWIPAPPLGSVPAMDRVMGGRVLTPDLRWRRRAAAGPRPSDPRPHRSPRPRRCRAARARAARAPGRC